MAIAIVTACLFLGLTGAYPSSDEALQSCGGAFYDPSKVRNKYISHIPDGVKSQPTDC
jgi:hypothetical protein